MTRFLSKVLKRWYLYIVLLIALPVVATLYANQTLQVYESSAYILVQPAALSGDNVSLGSPYVTPAQNGSDLMNEQMQSANFVLSVAQHTDLAQMYNLADRSTQGAVISRIQKDVAIAPASVGENALTITVDDKDPHVAQQIAQQVIQQFVAFFSQNISSLNKQQEVSLQQQLQTLEAKLKTDQTQINQYEQAHPSANSNTTTDPQLAALQQQYTQDLDQKNTIQDKLTQLASTDTSVTTNASSVFQVADAPQLPLTSTLSKKKLLIYTGGGLGGALALILLFAGLETRADRKVYSSRDLQTITEALDMETPAIEAIPLLRSISQRSHDDAHMPFSGVLVPVLTALPQLSSDEMNKELRRVAGVIGRDEKR